ncbi:hypothetical protein [Asanoa sp. NPDC050611]|uniref:hypothetical protein n=1 Tax=Asanoa sp. NPDC050611 TaxID=3157098 RepID=UPI0033F3E7C3
MRRLLAAVGLTVAALLFAGCHADSPPPAPTRAAGPAPDAATVACTTVERRFSEWDQTAPRVAAEVATATSDEMAEFRMAADEFFRQASAYTGGPASVLAILVDDYRATLDMARRAVAASPPNPDVANAAAESANRVRTSFAAFAAASGCSSA